MLMSAQVIVDPQPEECNEWPQQMRVLARTDVDSLKPARSPLEFVNHGSEFNRFGPGAEYRHDLGASPHGLLTDAREPGAERKVLPDTQPHRSSTKR